MTPKEKLINLLADKGYITSEIWCTKPAYRRGNWDTICWDCYASAPESKTNIHLHCYERVTDCVRYGIDIIQDIFGPNEYSVTVKEHH